MPQAWLARRRPGPRPLIEDPQFRLRALALASTGISRAGAAQRLGIEPDTLGNYLARGKAQPDIEPWGSFATEYLQAERGLEEAGAAAVAMRMQAIQERQRERLEWQATRGPEPVKPEHPPKGASPDERRAYEDACDEFRLEHDRWSNPPPEPGVGEMFWVLKVLSARYSREHGTHPHRHIDPFPDGAAWLERNALTRDQLVQLLTEPPEPVVEAMLLAREGIWRIISADGWRPPELSASDAPEPPDPEPLGSR